MSELIDVTCCHLSKKWRCGAETPGHLLSMRFIFVPTTMELMAIQRLRVTRLWLGWAQMTKKVPHAQPRPSQPPSKSVLATEKMGP
jgi:hypothetical protein